MSTKKDKFHYNDHFYMNLALNLARERLGLTGENPSVGCVIVKNDEVISFGQTGVNGRPHAEYNAIKSCKENLKGSKIYVTLEPCTHYGKTSPCTNIIIRSKIKEVIFSIIDPDIRTKLKSFKIYLQQFRNLMLSYERVINVIYDDLVKVYKPNRLIITIEFNLRGGISSKLTIDSFERELFFERKSKI